MRSQILKQVSIQIAFFIKTVIVTEQGRGRTVKSCLGEIPLTESKAEKLDILPRSRLSPLLEKCGLRIVANCSY